MTLPVQHNEPKRNSSNSPSSFNPSQRFSNQKRAADILDDEPGEEEEKDDQEDNDPETGDPRVRRAQTLKFNLEVSTFEGEKNKPRFDID